MRTAPSLCCAFALWGAGPVWCDTTPQAEVMLVLDGSGSMRETDPSAMRLRAAQLFAALLRADDSLGLIEFADSPQVLHPLTPLGEAREPLLAEVGAVGSDGQFTDITSALEQALASFDDDPSRPRCIVLLTDGAIDLPGGADANAQSASRLRTAVLSACAARNVPVHTIAFSSTAANDLLTEVATATQGQHHLVTDPALLHQVFADLFEAVDQPQSTPLVGDIALIDDSVQEVTFLLSHAGSREASVRLTPPEGNELTEESSHGRADVHWMSAPEFDLVTIENPTPGSWRVEPVGPGDRVMLITDLALETSPFPRRQWMRMPLAAQAWLTAAGQTVSNEILLSTVSFHLETTDPASHTAELNLRDDGQSDDLAAEDHIYGATAETGDRPGTLRVTVQARGATFIRQRSFMVDVLPDWIAAQVEPETPIAGEQFVIQASVSADIPSGELRHLRATVSGASSEAREITLLPVDQTLYASSVTLEEPGSHVLDVRAEGVDASGEPSSLALPPIEFNVIAAMAPTLPEPAESNLPPIMETAATPPVVAATVTETPASDAAIIATPPVAASPSSESASTSSTGGGAFPWGLVLGGLAAGALVLCIAPLVPTLRRTKTISRSERLALEVEDVARGVEAQLAKMMAPPAAEPVPGVAPEPEPATPAEETR